MPCPVPDRVNDVIGKDPLERTRVVFAASEGTFQVKDVWKGPSEAVKNTFGSSKGVFHWEIIDGS